MKLKIFNREAKGARDYAASLMMLFAGRIAGAAQETEENKEPQSGATSVKLSQEVMTPTTLAWQLQLEEYAIFKTEGQDGFAQNFRFRGIIPLKEGFLIKVPQLIRVITFLNTAPDGKTGLGDLTLNQFFLLTKKDWGSLVRDGIFRSLQEPTTSWVLPSGVSVRLSQLLSQILENGRCTGYGKIFSPYLEMTSMVLPLMPSCSQMSFIHGQMGFMLGLSPNGRSTIRREKWLYRWISGLDIYGRAN